MFCSSSHESRLKKVEVFVLDVSDATPACTWVYSLSAQGRGTDHCPSRVRHHFYSAARNECSLECPLARPTPTHARSNRPQSMENVCDGGVEVAVLIWRLLGFKSAFHKASAAAPWYGLEGRSKSLKQEWSRAPQRRNSTPRSLETHSALLGK